MLICVSLHGACQPLASPCQPSTRSFPCPHSLACSRWITSRACFTANFDAGQRGRTINTVQPIGNRNHGMEVLCLSESTGDDSELDSKKKKLRLKKKM